MNELIASENGSVIVELKQNLINGDDTKTAIDELKSALRCTSFGSSVFVDISEITRISYPCFVDFVRYVYKIGRKKRALLFNADQVLPTFEAVLTQLGRSALWVDSLNMLKIGGPAFLTNPYSRKCSYREIIELMDEKPFVISRDLVDRFKVSQSLALYKLDRLYKWGIAERDKVILPTGGFAFCYYLVSVWIGDQKLAFELPS